MSIVDDLNALTPAQYRVTRVAFEQGNGSIVAHWDVQIFNASGKQLATLHPTSQPGTQLRDAIITWYQESKAQFKSATGLTEYVPPETEPLP